MASNLGQILPMIVGHFGDAHPRVRWAAVNTVGQMCTDFGPGVQSEWHALVLPALVTTMDDCCCRVQAHAAAAIINFCEHCSRATLEQYLPDLLGKLMVLLQRNVRRVAEQAVTAIASVADVAESDFVPYYASFMPGLKKILQVAHGKEYRMLRGKSMECISLIGVAVGTEAFGADAKEVMDLLIASQQGMSVSLPDKFISLYHAVLRFDLLLLLRIACAHISRRAARAGRSANFVHAAGVRTHMQMPGRTVQALPPLRHPAASHVSSDRPRASCD